MPLNAAAFLRRYQHLRSVSGELPELPDDVRSAIESVGVSMRRHYDAPALKQAMASGEHVPSSLEEELTCAELMLATARARRSG